LGSTGRWLDRAAGWGVPADVTVLYRFLHPEAVDESALAALAVAVGSVGAFDCVFTTTDWFGSEVSWLAPNPAEPLRQLTNAVWAAFPDHPPYAGVFDECVPHLTVAERALGGPGALEAVEALVRPHLPFSQRIDHVLLIVGSQQPFSWRILHRLDLG
jgi:hypothetical protein